MPRKKISEFRAKQLVHGALDMPYTGWSVNSSQPLAEQVADVDGASFAVKVDQGVKGRFKKGLVKLDVPKAQLVDAVSELSKSNYQHFIIEPQVAHEGAERYFSVGYNRDGMTISYTAHGGVEVESHADTVQHVAVGDETDWDALADETGFSVEQLQRLVATFREHFLTFLEINPYVAHDNGVRILDAAVEVDDAGAFFTHAWREDDFRSAATLSDEEKTVVELGEKSPAAFKLDVINPDGSVFVLFSGGGASVAVADEIYNQGNGKLLGNYGECSGNPNAEEAYIYTKAILSLLLKSKAPHKVLLIAGAVANFTDIANTFTGTIRAIEEVASEMCAQNIKVFVRRGGPRQEIGLAKIETALQKHDLLGAVHSPKTSLPEVVAEALEEVAT